MPRLRYPSRKVDSATPQYSAASASVNQSLPSRWIFSAALIAQLLNERRQPLHFVAQQHVLPHHPGRIAVRVQVVDVLTDGQGQSVDVLGRGRPVGEVGF